jgi:hypothetical protein
MPGETILRIPGMQQHNERTAAMMIAMIIGRELFFAGAAGVGVILSSPQDGF